MKLEKIENKGDDVVLTLNADEYKQGILTVGIPKDEYQELSVEDECEMKMIVEGKTARKLAHCKGNPAFLLAGNVYIEAPYDKLRVLVNAWDANNQQNKTVVGYVLSWTLHKP